jgi:hypothetical protein
VHGLPIQFGKRRILGEPLDEVEIRNVRTPERNQVSQPLCDKAIPALAIISPAEARYG